MGERSTTDPGVAGQLRRVAVASFIGTGVEWYDYFLYGTAAALVFNKLFFPSLEPLAGTLAAFATYAVGFAARPLGGAVFGHYGDRIGRKRMLVVTLLMMGSATFLIGCLPTYSTIGVWAPILLVVLRFLQGFAVGGEWGGAVLLAVEHAPEGRRGLFGGWPQLGSPAGLILSTVAFSIVASLPDDAFLSWGWRLPFLFSIVLVVVGLIIRLQVVDSPVFERLKEAEARSRVPLLEVIREHPRTVLLALLAITAGIGGFYIYTTFLLAYATEQVGISSATILHAVTFAAVVELVTIVPFAALSDRVGRRAVAGFGALWVAIMSFPLFALVNTGKPALIWLGLGVLILGGSAHYGVIASFTAELFATRVRYSGISLSYQLCGALTGGTAPLIATALLGASGGAYWPVAAYLRAAGARLRRGGVRRPRAIPEPDRAGRHGDPRAGAMSADARARVLERVDRGWDAEVEFLRGLVRRPSPLGEEASVQRFAAEQLREMDLDVDVWEIDPDEIAHRPGYSPVDWSYAGRPNVAARMPGAGGGRSLVLNGHVDVVPATPEHHWSHDPWGAEIADGRMWGRGAADMKAGVAAMIYAVRAIRDAGVGLRGDLSLETVIEEECTGNGALAARARGYRGDAAVIPEPFGHRVLEAQVGVMWVRVTVRGRGAHAERADQASNAVVKAARLVEAVQRLEAEVNAEARPVWFAGTSHPLNYNVGIMRGGDWTSTVPEECVFEVRLSSYPGADLAEIERRFRDALLAAAREDDWLREHPPEIEFYAFRAEGCAVARDEPLLAVLGSAHRAVRDDELEPFSFTGTTDVRFFNLYEGTPATCYGPTGGNLHAPDEWVDLASVRDTTKVLALAAMEWCGVAG